MDFAFPIYGLRDYKGLKYVENAQRLWTPDGPWWYVAVRYGVVRDGTFATIITDAKLAPHQRPHGIVGPTGVADARRIARLELSTITSASTRPFGTTGAAARAIRTGQKDIETSTVSMQVDEQPVSFDVTKIGDFWAADADLQTAAVAVYSNFPALNLNLGRVNDLVASYLDYSEIIRTPDDPAY